MTIYIFYTNPISYGGHASLTVHLMHGLRANGVEVKLLRIAQRTEYRLRDFGYGESYQNISLEKATILAKHAKSSLIVAPSKPKIEIINSLINVGVPIVIHDTFEMNHGYDWRSASKVFVIRHSMLRHIPGAIFVKHPYDPAFKQYIPPTGAHAAVSVCRIDKMKNIPILLDANRLLPKRKQIRMYGFENRSYTRFKIMPKYPEWVQSQTQFPKAMHAAVAICHKAHYTVDMSAIPLDGGGTQYTFLEAIDAGSCLVLNKAWVQGFNREEIQAGKNCLVVENAKELAATIAVPPAVHFAQNARKLLTRHDAKQVAKDWIKAINA